MKQNKEDCNRKNVKISSVMYWRMCYNVKGAKCRKDRKIMAVIYENKVKELGKDIMMMNGGDFIINFWRQQLRQNLEIIAIL